MAKKTDQKAFHHQALILVIAFLFLIAISATVYFQSSPKKLPQLVTEASPVVIASVNPSDDKQSPVLAPSPAGTPAATTPNEKGSDLHEIKYKLPEGWKAEYKTDVQGLQGLMITPPSGGGFFYLKVYSYFGQGGRRDYYCKLTQYCIPSTYFTARQIGNIPGYTASSLDNSGGGPEYFGAKGDKFYIISSFGPPLPNEFEKNRETFLNSLIF